MHHDTLRSVADHGHFGAETPATRDLDQEAVERQRAAHRLIEDNYHAVHDRRT